LKCVEDDSATRSLSLKISLIYAKGFVAIAYERFYSEYPDC